MTPIETGDWIRIPQLWPGVWRVSRTLSGFTENRWSLDEELKPSRRRILFCYRLVNSSWKRSFSHQCCEASLAHAVSPEDHGTVEGLLSSDKKLARAFDKYQASQKPIDLVSNLGFGDLAESQLEHFPEVCSRLLSDRIEAGITMDEVLVLLRDPELGAHRHKFPNMATLQLVSPGHELRGDRFVYRRFRTLDF